MRADDVLFWLVTAAAAAGVSWGAVGWRRVRRLRLRLRTALVSAHLSQRPRRDARGRFVKAP